MMLDAYFESKNILLRDISVVESNDQTTANFTINIFNFPNESMRNNLTSALDEMEKMGFAYTSNPSLETDNFDQFAITLIGPPITDKSLKQLGDATVTGYINQATAWSKDMRERLTELANKASQQQQETLDSFADLRGCAAFDHAAAEKGIKAAYTDLIALAARILETPIGQPEVATAPTAPTGDAKALMGKVVSVTQDRDTPG